MASRSLIEDSSALKASDKYNVGQVIKTIHGLQGTIIDVLESGKFDIRYKNSRHGCDYNVSKEFFTLYDPPKPTRKNSSVSSYEYVPVDQHEKVWTDVGSVSSTNIVSGKRPSTYRL